MGKLFGRSGICYHRQKNAFRAHEIVTVESFTKNMKSRPLSRIKIKTFICRFRPRTQTLHMIAGRIICIPKTKWSNSISIWLWLLNISQMVFFPACKAFAVMMPLSIYPCPLWHSVLAHHTHNLFIIKYENILISTTGNWHTITRHTFIVNISEGGGTFRSRKNIFCGSHGIASPLKHSAHSLLQECTVDMKAKLFRLGGNGKLAQNVPSILSATVVLIIIIWKPIDH